MNIAGTSHRSAGSPSVGVIPVDAPTVATADTVSNSTATNVSLLSSWSPSANTKIDGDEQEGDRQRPVDQEVRDAATERLGGRPAARGGQDREQQDRERVDLDPARGGAGRAADEHQRHDHEQARDGQLARGQRAEARRPQRRRLEGGIEDPLALGHRPERRRVVPLERRDRRRAPDEQHRRRQQHELRLEREARPAALCQGVADDREPKAARDDQEADRHQDEGVVGEAGEAAEAAHEVEARVVEGRHRVEQAVPRGLRRDRRSERRTRPSGRPCPTPSAMRVNRATPPDDMAHRAEVAHARRLLREDPVAERRPASDEQEQQQRGPGHEPEPAELDEAHDRDLPERAPVGRRCRRRRAP